MGFKFTDLAKKTKPGTLDLGDGDVIQFTFRPALLTPNFVHNLSMFDEARMSAASAAEADEVIQDASEQVVKVIATWDVLDEDGTTPFPLDVERLRADIPVQVQVALLMQCTREMQPGEARAPETTAASSPVTSKPSGATS